MAEKSTPASSTFQKLDTYQDLLPLHSKHPERYPFLLESVAHGTPQSRFDILFAFPEDSISLDNLGHVASKGIDLKGDRFLDCLDEWWLQEKENSRAENQDHLPFRGGWFVYLGYELVAEIENTLNLPEDVSGLPVAAAVRCPAAIIRDHQNKCNYIVTESDRELLLKIIEHDISNLDLFENGLESHKEDQLSASLIEDDEKLYLKAIQRVKQYITDGDVFQVNLSRAWQAELKNDVEPSDIYQRLRIQNASPFAAIIKLNQTTIISSSPERLVQVNQDHDQQKIVQTRPIAGTRPRGLKAEEDLALSRELLSHPKEQAEHIMLIDLERNDLGRVCIPGTIEVNELMSLESFAHVHHIVSNVRGQLKPEVTPADVIRAVFPGGTITGCPKVRCMEIIAEQEQTGRGAYTGSIGYINRNGDMDLNILIRTLVQRNNQLFFRTGAGIVADSIPEKELEETRAKARGLLLSLKTMA